MKKSTILGIALLIGFSAIAYSQDDVFVSNKLSEAWITEGLEVPESVLPVPDEGIMYVSNIAAQNPLTKEKQGFISIVNTDGSIKKLKWATGLNSPKGMAIYKDKLYVSEVDKIGVIDLATGKKIKEYPVEGATFLNDIAADQSGNLYITDSQTGTIHILSDGKVDVFVKNDQLSGPNGLAVVGDNLFVGAGNNILKIKLKSKEVKEFLPETGGVDGIAILNDDMALFSDWPGKVHLMKKGNEKELILDTKNSDTFKTADFGYIPSKHLLIIPTFFGNTLVAYELKK